MRPVTVLMADDHPIVTEGLRRARVLKISPRTVEFHRHRAMKILGVHTTAELVQYAIKHNLIVRPG